MVDNLDRLQKRIDRLPPVAVAAARAELHRQANLLASLMRAGVPIEAGVLRGSIRTEDGAHALQVLVRAGGEATTRDGYDYALAVEFGTQHADARPFFFPAYRLRRKAIRSAVNRAVRKAIKEQFEK